MFRLFGLVPVGVVSSILSAAFILKPYVVWLAAVLHHSFYNFFDFLLTVTRSSFGLVVVVRIRRVSDTVRGCLPPSALHRRRDLQGRHHQHRRCRNMDYSSFFRSIFIRLPIQPRAALHQVLEQGTGANADLHNCTCCSYVWAF